jgi:hypothetical protein
MNDMIRSALYETRQRVAQGILLLALGLRAVGVEVSGPRGLSLADIRPPQPNYELMLMNARLNLQIVFKNGTGRTLNYSSGSARFYSGTGQLLRTAPISQAEFLLRRDYGTDGDKTLDIPHGTTASLDLLDFPFFTDWSAETFEGFDPKRAPATVNVELSFAEFTTPFAVMGIGVEVFEHNGTAYRFPLEPPPEGNWRVSNSHEFSVHHSDSRSQRFAYDISVQKDGSNEDPDCDPEALGLREIWQDHPYFDPRATYGPEDYNECHYAWKRPAFAAAAGTVTDVAKTNWDNFPVGEKNTDSNKVFIDHGHGEIGAYFHFAKDTVAVSTDQQVVTGQFLARVGNSGTSTRPHLHFHLVDAAKTDGVPAYFNNVFFAPATGGPQVRQLRSAIPSQTLLTIDPSPIPFNSPGQYFGPGTISEIAATHDSVESPMRLRLPVTVNGSVAPGAGSAVADAGDVIEDVYRFTVCEAGRFSARLDFDAGADLDLIFYDQDLRAILPSAAKTLARPELLSAILAPGTYYVFVSVYDRDASPGTVNYSLDLSFSGGPSDIYVDYGSACPLPRGNLNCVLGQGGPFPTVLGGLNAVCLGGRLFVHGGSYPETLVINQSVELRAYNGSAVVGQ